MKIAICGVSHWHNTFYGTAFSEAATIVGACDDELQKAEGFVSRYGGKAYCHIEELLKKTKPDFVMAMGRHVDMPKIVSLLLETGIPFGIEKPVGVRSSDLIPLIQSAQQRKTFIAVPLINRYSLLWEKIAVLERMGRFGEKIHANFRSIGGTVERYKRDDVSWMLDPDLSGGGSLRNLGIHGADAFIMFASDIPDVLAARLGYTDKKLKIEEYSAALVVANGIIGTLESGYTFATGAAAGDFEWRIASTNCYIIDRGKELTVSTLDDGKTEIINNLSAAERYKMFGKDTLERLRNGLPPIADLGDCFRAMQLLDNIYARSKETKNRDD